MLAALPTGQPGAGQIFDTMESSRSAAISLDVLLDVDTVSETGSCFESFAVLLATHGVRTWRYSDGGPPSDVRQSGNPHCDQGEREPHDSESGGTDQVERFRGLPFGWVEVVATGDGDSEGARPAVTHVARSFDGKAERSASLWGHRKQPVGESTPAALLGRAAAATRMGLLVTNRSELTGANGEGRWRDGCLLVTPEEAVATLGLLLRSVGIFSVRPYSVTSRGSYLWLALDSLLPHYPRWAAACSVDGVAGPGLGRIHYLSTATEGRLFQVLNARDQLAVAMSRRRIDWVEVADTIDRLLVFLLAAMDSTAGVVRELAFPTRVPAKEAKWQGKSFRKALRTSAPELAALFDSGRAADLHLTLRELRNTIHGGGLTQTYILVDDGDREHKLSVPLDEVDGLPAAVARQTGGDLSRWGLHVTEDRVWVQPLPLADALTREGFRALDGIFEHTPLAALTDLAVELDERNDSADKADAPDEVHLEDEVDKEVDPDSEAIHDDDVEPNNNEPDDETDAVESGNWQTIERMLDTRGSAMYLWHLGMHPRQLH